jgi:hypothetical protein
MGDTAVISDSDLYGAILAAESLSIELSKAKALTYVNLYSKSISLLEVPLYTRGLAVRLILLCVERHRSIVGVVISKNGLVNSLIRIINECANRREAPSISYNNMCKVSLNCSVLLTRLFSGANKYCHISSKLDPHSASLRMHERPELTQHNGIRKHDVLRNEARDNIPTRKAVKNNLAALNEEITHSNYSTPHYLYPEQKPHTQSPVLKRDTNLGAGWLSFGRRHPFSSPSKDRNKSSFLGYEQPRMWYPKPGLLLKVKSTKQLSPGPDIVLDSSFRSNTAPEKLINKGKISTIARPVNTIHGTIEHLKSDMPLKFLIYLKNRKSTPIIKVQLIKDRAYLLLAAWMDEMRLRAMGAALLRWWWLVIQQRRWDYKIGLAVRSLGCILKRSIRTKIKENFLRWLRLVVLTRDRERLQAALFIQRCYRGLAGRRAYSEYLLKFISAIPIQTCWRRHICRVKYFRQKHCFVCLQALVRGYLNRSYLRVLHSCATMIQAAIRMYPLRSRFVVVATSICRLQTSYRAWTARKLFYKMIEDRIRLFEIELSASIFLQRVWRGHMGKTASNSLKLLDKLRDESALKIQKWWYTINGQFATFLLMRLLAFQDKSEEDQILQKRIVRRTNALLLLQKYTRRWAKRKMCRERQLLAQAATHIQCIWRGLSCKRSYQVFLQKRNAAVKIQNCFKARYLNCINATFCIQRVWISRKYRNKYGFTHTIAVAMREQRAQLETWNEWKYTNSRTIQMAVRYWRARREKAKVIAVIKIQRMYRVFCHKQFQYWQHCKLCHRISELSIRNVIELGIKNATNNYFASQIQAAINMQAVYRGHSARFKFREAQSARRRVQMAALNIQHFLRYQRARKNMKKSREQKASFEQNRFRENFTSLHKLLAGIFSQCGSFFDSFDATKGTGIATIFLRLGCADLAEATKMFLRKWAKSHQHALSLITEWPFLMKVLADKKTRDELKTCYESTLIKDTTIIKNSSSAQYNRDMMPQLVLTRLQALACKDPKTIEQFLPIEDCKLMDNVCATLLKSHFGTNRKKAIMFADATLKCSKVSYYQLEHFIDSYQRNESRRCRSEVHFIDYGRSGPGWKSSGSRLNKKVGFGKEEAEWEEHRVIQCFEYFQMGLEMILHKLSDSLLPLRRNLAQALKSTSKIWHWRIPHTKFPALYSCCNSPAAIMAMKSAILRMHKSLKEIKLWNDAAQTLQKAYNNFRMAKRVRALKIASQVNQAFKMYLRERNDIRGGLCVRLVAAADRAQEEKRDRIRVIELHHRQLLITLSHTIKFGYREYDDVATGITHYINDRTGEDAVHRPSYNLSDHCAATRIQQFLRKSIKKTKCNLAQLAQAKQEEINLMETVWQSQEVARRCLVTLNLSSVSIDQCKTKKIVRRTVRLYKTVSKEKQNGHGKIIWLKQLEKILRNKVSCQEATSFVKLRLSEESLIHPNKTIVKAFPELSKIRIMSKQKSKCNCLVNLFGDNFRPVFSDPCCISHPRCILRNGHEGFHQFVDDGLNFETCFGWGELDLASHSHGEQARVDSVGGKHFLCWSFEYIKERYGSEVFGESHASKAKDPSYLEFCEKSLRSLPTSILKNLLNDLRVERCKVGSILPTILYFDGMRCVHGICGMICREICLRKFSSFRKGAKYSSVITTVNLNMATLRIHMKSKNFVILSTPKTLLMAPSPPPASNTLQGTKVRLVYSHVEMPYGWRQSMDDDGRIFYINSMSGDTSWTRPEYSAQENFSAKVLQRYAMGMMCRRQYLRRLRTISIYDMAICEINRVKNIAWVGYGAEGLTTKILLSRLGLGHYNQSTENRKKNVQITEEKFVSSIILSNDDKLKNLRFKNVAAKRRFMTMIRCIKSDQKRWDTPLKTFRPRLCAFYRGKKGIMGREQRDLYVTVSKAIPARKTFTGTVKSANAIREPFVVEQGQKINISEEFSFLSGKKLLKGLIERYQNCSEVQIKSILNSIKSSKFPLTTLLFVKHLQAYKGKPRLCVKNIHEILESETCSSIATEKMVFDSLRPVVKRIMGRAISLQLLNLSQRLQSLLVNATKIVDTALNLLPKDHNVLDSLEFTAMVQSVMTVEGIEINCARLFQTKKSAHFFIGALLLRIALQWVVCGDFAARYLQRCFRRFILKRQGNRVRLKARRSVTKIQAQWRRMLSRRYAFSLRSQYLASWEQLYDEERQIYYFFDNLTQSSHWNSPPIPFKPCGWWPPEEENEIAAAGFCSSCFTERATRICNGCFDKKTGGGIEYCFACFALGHKDSMEMLSHTFNLTSPVQDVHLYCIECESPASIKCRDCEDSYCKACFRRMHKKGKRKLHSYYTFDINCPACVECKDDIASVKCVSCDDYFCNACFKLIHEHGKKVKHQVLTLNAVKKDVLVVLQPQVKDQLNPTGHLGRRGKITEGWRNLRPTCPPPPKF